MSLEDLIPLSAISFGSFYLLSISIKEINKTMLHCYNNNTNNNINNFLLSLFINGFFLGLSTSACLSLIFKKYR
jgi:hypothetical protein